MVAPDCCTIVVRPDSVDTFLVVSFLVELWCLYVFFVMCNPQNNLQNLAGQLSDVLENLSPIVRARV